MFVWNMSFSAASVQLVRISLSQTVPPLSLTLFFGQRFLAMPLVSSLLSFLPSPFRYIKLQAALISASFNTPKEI